MEKSLPRLRQAERDIQRVQGLRGELGDAIQHSRYVSLIDTFLPQILAIIVDHSRQLAMLLEAVKDRVGKNGAEPAAAREEVL